MNKENTEHFIRGCDYKMLIKEVNAIDPAAAHWLRHYAWNERVFKEDITLSGVMIWDETPQGYQYWYNIALEIEQNT